MPKIFQFRHLQARWQPHQHRTSSTLFAPTKTNAPMIANICRKTLDGEVQFPLAIKPDDVGMRGEESALAVLPHSSGDTDILRQRKFISKPWVPSTKSCPLSEEKWG